LKFIENGEHTGCLFLFARSGESLDQRVAGHVVGVVDLVWLVWRP
jgi:hypothetical protein